MKTLELKRMENFQGGTKFTPDANCAVAAVGFGLGVAGLLSVGGALAGLSLMATTIGTLTSCFPYD